MTRSSGNAKKEEIAKMRHEKWPQLESTLDVFRQSGFSAEDALLVIKAGQEGAAQFPDRLNEKFKDLGDDQRDRQKDALEAAGRKLFSAFKAVDAQKFPDDAENAMARLESDLPKVFTNAYFGLNGELNIQLRQQVNVAANRPVEATQQPSTDDKAQTAPSARFSGADIAKLAGTITAAAGAAQGAVRNWGKKDGESDKKTARRKAVVFAVVSATMLGATALVMRQSGLNLGNLKAKPAQNSR